MARECRVKCSVQAGMFRDEYLVSVESTQGQVNAFVHHGSVELTPGEERHQRGPGKLRAYCLGSKAGEATLVLPQTTIENGPVITVRKDQLVR